MTLNEDCHDRNHRGKVTLFCIECEHEGHIPDDWLEIQSDNVRFLVCPDCGAKIDQRTARHPRPPAEAD